MTRKPTLLVDEVEDSGGPHWLSAARRKLEAEEAKKQTKPKPKGLDQIRREHRTKYRVNTLRQRSVDEIDFMQECIELLTEEGADDPEYACQLLWDDGDESIIFERAFDESKHPRDEDGKWTSGGEGSISIDWASAGKVSPEVKKHIENVITGFSIDYPEVSTHVSGVKFTSSSTNEFDAFSREIRIGRYGLDGSVDALDHHHDTANKPGFAIAGGVKALITHEFAHAIDDYVKQGDDVVKDEWFNAKKKLEREIGAPSEYGKKNTREWLAEQFTAERLGQREKQLIPVIDSFLARVVDKKSKSFDESKHPRDEDGKWTSGGGNSDDNDDDIARSKSPASDLLAKNYKEEIPLDEIKAKLSPEFKAESAKAEAEMKGQVITSKAHLGPDGKYTPERAALHRSIIRKLFTPDKIAAAVPKSGEKPTLTLSGGRPAAGKTTSLEKELGGKIQSSFYISADEIQEHLPGYKGRHAGLYNGEAQDIALQAEKVARHMGLNIIYDATLKSKQPALERVQDYKEHGYEVDGYFIHTTPAISAARTAQRFMSDKNGKGRYIPLEISYNSRTNESTFDSLIPHLRHWAIYDNNGTKPERIVGTGL